MTASSLIPSRWAAGLTREIVPALGAPQSHAAPAQPHEQTNMFRNVKGCFANNAPTTIV